MEEYQIEDRAILLKKLIDPCASLLVSERIYNVLSSAGIEKIHQLVIVNPVNIIKQKDLGKSTYNEINAALNSQYLLKIGMDLSHYKFTDKELNEEDVIGPAITPPNTPLSTDFLQTEQNKPFAHIVKELQQFKQETQSHFLQLEESLQRIPNLCRAEAKLKTLLNKSNDLLNREYRDSAQIHQMLSELDALKNHLMVSHLSIDKKITNIPDFKDYEDVVCRMVQDMRAVMNSVAHETSILKDAVNFMIQTWNSRTP